MRYPHRYQKQGLLGLIGLGIICVPFIFKIPGQFIAFNATNDLETREQIERNRIDQRKKTADKLSETGMMPEAKILQITKYLDTPKQNPNPDTTSFLEDETVIVVDSAGKCIGRIRNRKWEWKHFYQNVCKNIPVQ